MPFKVEPLAENVAIAYYVHLPSFPDNGKLARN